MDTNDETNPRETAASTFMGLGIRSDLAGKSYINLLRCSTMGQADTSPDGQKASNDAFAAMQGMHWAGDDIYAEGVSGSQTFNREDIHEILERKRTRNDFDVVLVFELGRMTRGGIRHGNVVEDELRKAGVEVISSTELIPDGPTGELIKAVKHFSNQQQAYNISKAVARGLAQSLARANRPAAGRTNYGLDRLYLGPDGSKRTLIRWDGNIQLRLDPMTMKEIGRAARPPTQPPRGSRHHQQGKRLRRARFMGYQKQKDERSLLIAGAPDKRQIVCDIWRKYYCEDIGAHRIIKWLRSLNVPSPSGGDWNLSSIRNIVENPIYLGIEVRHRWTKALYHKLGPDGPVPVKVDQDQLQKEGRVAVPTVERSREEWVLAPKEELKDFLPPEVREIAVKTIIALLDADTVTRRQMHKKKRKNRHDDSSPYILSHTLHSAVTGHPMRGETSIRMLVGGKKVTRYYFDYSTASKAISGMPARRVPAAPLEEAVLAAVLDVLKDSDWVTERVRAHVEQMHHGTQDAEQQRETLLSEREEITRRLKRIHQTSGDLADNELAELVADDNARLLAIRRELVALDTDAAQRPTTSQEAIAAVTKRLNGLLADWQQLPRADLKQLLAALIDDLRIDLVTLETRFTIRLPQQAMNPLSSSGAEVRLNFRSAWSSSLETNGEGGPVIDTIECQSDRRGRCYNCSRKRRAKAAA